VVPRAYSIAQSQGEFLSKALRIGLLGASRIAPQAVVTPAAKLEGVEVCAVAARDRHRAADFARTHAIARVIDSYDALIDDPGIDLVYNALPPHRHADLSIRALKAGKHVLCEKPLAMNSAEAAAMVRAARDSGRRLIEAFHYRYHPAFADCLSVLRSGELGDIRDIEAAFDVAIPFAPQELRHRPETGGGAMMDLGCYPLNWALAIAAEAPAAVTATASVTRAGVDASMQATLEFGCGITARISCSMAEGVPFRADMTVRGSAGSLCFHNPLAPHDGGYIAIDTAHGRRRLEASPVPTYEWQLAAVVGALASGEALPTEGDAMLLQQQSLDRVYRAAGLGALRENGRPVGRLTLTP
jgi:predicted dehydrogenase